MKMKRIISLVVAITFSVNSISYALGPSITSDKLADDTRPGTKNEMYALGQKLFAAKVGPGAIDFFNSNHPAFQGYELLKDPLIAPHLNKYQTKFIKADYDNIPTDWERNNPILRQTDLIIALQMFRDQARIRSEKLEIAEGWFPVHENAGELPIARIEPLGGGQYILIVHTKFVQMWNHIRKNDVWFEVNLTPEDRRTVSVAWGVFYRLAKHEMAELSKRDRTFKSLGHVMYYSNILPHRVEGLANEIDGNYATLNDAIWMWFLGSYCFANSTRYDNNMFFERLNWFFEGKEALGRELHLEFPNLLKDYDKMMIARAFSCAINYNFFYGRPYAEVPVTYDVKQKFMDQYFNNRERSRILAGITEKPIYATGKDEEGEVPAGSQVTRDKSQEAKKELWEVAALPSAVVLSFDLKKGEIIGSFKEEGEILAVGYVNLDINNPQLKHLLDYARISDIKSARLLFNQAGKERWPLPIIYIEGANGKHYRIIGKEGQFLWGHFAKISNFYTHVMGLTHIRSHRIDEWDITSFPPTSLAINIPSKRILRLPTGRGMRAEGLMAFAKSSAITPEMLVNYIMDTDLYIQVDIIRKALEADTEKLAAFEKLLAEKMNIPSLTDALKKAAKSRAWNTTQLLAEKLVSIAGKDAIPSLTDALKEAAKSRAWSTTKFLAEKLAELSNISAKNSRPPMGGGMRAEGLTAFAKNSAITPEMLVNYIMDTDLYIQVDIIRKALEADTEKLAAFEKLLAEARADLKVTKRQRDKETKRQDTSHKTQADGEDEKAQRGAKNTLIKTIDDLKRFLETDKRFNYTKKNESNGLWHIYSVKVYAGIEKTHPELSGKKLTIKTITNDASTEKQNILSHVTKIFISKDVKTPEESLNILIQKGFYRPLMALLLYNLQLDKGQAQLALTRSLPVTDVTTSQETEKELWEMTREELSKVIKRAEGLLRKAYHWGMTVSEAVNIDSVSKVLLRLHISIKDFPKKGVIDEESFINFIASLIDWVDSSEIKQKNAKLIYNYLKKAQSKKEATSPPTSASQAGEDEKVRLPDDKSTQSSQSPRRTRAGKSPEDLIRLIALKNGEIETLSAPILLKWYEENYEVLGFEKPAENRNSALRTIERDLYAWKNSLLARGLVTPQLEPNRPASSTNPTSQWKKGKDGEYLFYLTIKGYKEAADACVATQQRAVPAAGTGRVYDKTVDEKSTSAVELMGRNDLEELVNIARQNRKDELIKSGVYNSLETDELMLILSTKDEQYEWYYSLDESNRNKKTFLEWLSYLGGPVLREKQDIAPTEKEIDEYANSIYELLTKTKADLEKKSIVSAISEYIIDIGLHEGPGGRVVEPTTDEIALFYPIHETVSRQAVEIYLPQATRNSLTDAVKQEITNLNKRIRERTGRRDDAISFKAYDDYNLEKLLANNANGARRIFVSDSTMTDVLFKSLLNQDKAEILKGKRLISTSIPQTHDKKELSVYQAWVVKIALLSALVEESNMLTVGGALREELEGRLDSDVNINEFITNLAGTEKEAIEAVAGRINYFLGKIVKLSQFIGEQIRILKAFWIAA